MSSMPLRSDASERRSGRDRRAGDAFSDASGTNIRRFFDPKFKAWAIKVLPGEHKTTADPNEMLVTVLGSCVSACIRDPVTGFGGLNHYMLPDGGDDVGQDLGTAARYGNYAMEVLINEIIRSGCPRERLEIKLFGGANVIKGSTLIGDKNIAFVRRYLEIERLPIAGEDLGGNFPRRIHYFPVTGKVQRLYLKRRDDDQLLRSEESYRKRLKSEPVQGEIELF